MLTHVTKRIETTEPLSLLKGSVVESVAPTKSGLPGCPLLSNFSHLDATRVLKPLPYSPILIFRDFFIFTIMSSSTFHCIRPGDRRGVKPGVLFACSLVLFFGK